MGMRKRRPVVYAPRVADRRGICRHGGSHRPEGTAADGIVVAKPTGRQLLISVADQGVGIPAGEVERVFDRMYRIEQRLTPEVSGMGLGLAASSSICKSLNGELNLIRSEATVGSKFQFTLPIKLATVDVES